MVLFCLAWVVVAVGLALLIHRFVPAKYFEEHYEQAGFIFAVIGVVYAVILAFVAIGVWERFEAAEVRTYTEASALVDVYRDADAFPQRATLRKELRDYTELVIGDEWPKMRVLGSSAAAHTAVERMTRDITELHPTTPEQQDVHQSMLASIDAVLADRAARVSMGATGLNQIVWLVVGGGAFITIAFSFVFPFKRRRMQALIVGALTLSIAIVFYLITAIDYPFRGDIAIQPHAFENAVATYATIDGLDDGPKR